MGWFFDFFGGIHCGIKKYSLYLQVITAADLWW